MAQSTIRIGIVGAGGIVRQRHIPGLRKIPDVAIVAVCNSTPESTARAAQELGIPRQFTNWRDLVEWDGIDAVLIGTQPYMHREIDPRAPGGSRPGKDTAGSAARWPAPAGGCSCGRGAGATCAGQSPAGKR